MTVPGERNEEKLNILEALKSLPVTLEGELEGLSDAVLRYRPAEHELSIKETVGHLLELSEVWHRRLYAITSLTDPRWPGFDTEGAVHSHNHQDGDVRQLVGSIREWRSKTADLLAHAVDWTRLGQDPDLGRRSLKQWAEFVVELDKEHVARIRGLKEAQTTARLP
jgi:hypothetical protein